jgi:phenylalanyl-tRNA synthetase alpha chain
VVADLEADLKTSWTEIQQTRLKELAADDADLQSQFDGAAVRDKAFQQLEKKLVKVERQKLQQLRDVHRRPRLCRLESRLTDILIQNDFVQVTTPTILSKGLLSKMSIDDTHPLTSQIFWLDKDKCLRPMLAPHLYFVLQEYWRIGVILR